MLKTIKASDLKFPLDRRNVSSQENERPKKPANWLHRLIARHASAKILNSDSSTFQFGGYTGALCLSYEMVDAEKEQIAHWLLHDVGYRCCTADIQELTSP